MNRIATVLPYLALAALAASGCKDPTPRETSVPVPTPVSASVKPEIQTPKEVASVVPEPEMVFADAGTDVFAFGGLAHATGCREDHLGVGRGLVESGQFAEGIQELERGVYDQPESFELRKTLGTVYRSTGELELAVGHLRSAVEQVEDAETWRMLAQTYYELKDHDQAIVAIRKATRLEPVMPGPYRLLAKVYASKNMWKESIEASEEAIARGSDSPWTYNNMGYAYLVIGHYEDAVRELEKAVSFDTGVSPTIWNNLGLAYEKSGKLRDAHAAYQAALAGDPGYVKAKVNLDRAVKIAKAQGLELGVRTADISRSEMEPAPVDESVEVEETPVEETSVEDGVEPMTEPAFDVPAEDVDGVE